MATPHHIQIEPTDTGILKFAETGTSAAKVSELLQKDLEVPRPVDHCDLLMLTRPRTTMSSSTPVASITM